MQLLFDRGHKGMEFPDLSGIEKDKRPTQQSSDIHSRKEMKTTMLNSCIPTLKYKLKIKQKCGQSKIEKCSATY